MTWAVTSVASFPDFAGIPDFAVLLQHFPDFSISIQFAWSCWSFWWLVCQNRTIIKWARCVFLNLSWNPDSSFKNDFKRCRLSPDLLKYASFGSIWRWIQHFQDIFLKFCEVISPFLALCSFRKKFASRYFGVMHFSGFLAVSCWQHWTLLRRHAYIMETNH